MIKDYMYNIVGSIWKQPDDRWKKNNVAETVTNSHVLFNSVFFPTQPAIISKHLC